MERIHVAAAAIRDTQGRILTTRRADDAHKGGLWEFPGGKLEPGEGIEAGLMRELHEELGITPKAYRPLIRVHHDYDDKSVLLDVWLVTAWGGKAHGREGQPLRWQLPTEMTATDFPEADAPIIRACRLPDRYLITPDCGEDRDAFLAQLRRRIDDGVKLVQYRQPRLDTEDWQALAREVMAIANETGVTVLLNAEPEQVAEFGAAGIHLNSRQLKQATERPLADEYLVCASCHDAAEIEQALGIGADFLVLSPVAATKSHPDAVPLGWDRFHELTDEVPVPVYALGGMAEADLQAAWQHGGQGVAAIRALWQG